MVYTLINHRNDVIKCSKLCSETTWLWLPLEFSTFYEFISMVYKSVDHGKFCGWFVEYHNSLNGWYCFKSSGVKKKKQSFLKKKIIIIKTRHWLFTISRQLAQSALVCQHLYATVCNFCNMYSSVVQCSVYCHCHTVNLRTHFKYCENAVLHRFLFLFCRREQRSLQ